MASQVGHWNEQRNPIFPNVHLYQTHSILFYSLDILVCDNWLNASMQGLLTACLIDMIRLRLRDVSAQGHTASV